MRLRESKTENINNEHGTIKVKQETYHRHRKTDLALKQSGMTDWGDQENMEHRQSTKKQQARTFKIIMKAKTITNSKNKTLGHRDRMVTNIIIIIIVHLYSTLKTHKPDQSAEQ